ncbi:MAG TPA: hypothetical protein HPQ04_13205, partial [Rhodospirillaceae bacterium]|nr:hypothetical protein [Rhodospirillaceae bacterium]
MAGKSAAAPGAGELAETYGPLGPALSQSEQDFILAQILKYWHVNTHTPEAAGLVLQAVIVIRA